MDNQPADGADDRERGSRAKRAGPAEVLRNPGRQRGRHGAADLAAHVHNARKDSRAAPGDIDGN